MIKVFNSQQEFSNYTQGGMNAGDLYYVKENKSIHFRTNNIDNVDTDYHMEAYPVLIEGLFTQNGIYKPENADGYNAVVVNVDGGSSSILIKGSFNANGTYTPENADGYSEVVINVPIPDGYLLPSGTKTISANGTSIDVASYESVDVNVPIPSGYIQPSGTKSISENGTVDVTNYASAEVNVPIPSGYIIPSGTKSIVANGTGIDVTQYATVDVAVPASGITPTGTYSVTSNGTYDITNYASVEVNVSGGSQPVYTDATISDASPILCSLNAGETIDVYNLNHANVMIMISDIAAGMDSYAPGGTYEHLYYTAGDVNGMQSEGVYVQLVNGTKGSSAIKYRIF